MNHNEGCTICGEELIYSQQLKGTTCHLCGNTFESDVQCISGHYVCDACHSLKGIDLIEHYCNHSTGEDPIKMAVSIMKHPSIKMHGPEHHYLVPAVLISSYYNRLNTPAALKQKKLNVARKRAEIVPGGHCGSHGACGAGIGTGIFMSIITESTPLHKNEWKLSNRMTSEALLEISNNGGPRCCKRDSFIAIEQAVRFLQENMSVEMPLGKVKCIFSERNKECLFDACLYYPDQKG